MCEWSGSCACDSHVTAALLTACVTCHCYTLCRTPHIQWYWPRSTATPPGRPSSLIVGRRSVMFDSLEHTTGNHPLAPTAPLGCCHCCPSPSPPFPPQGHRPVLVHTAVYRCPADPSQPHRLQGQGVEHGRCRAEAIPGECPAFCGSGCSQLSNHSHH